MELTYIQQEIMGVLKRSGASYANPVSSAEISKTLNVTPSYVREQGKALFDGGLIRVRRGPGGGYFLNRERED